MIDGEKCILAKSDVETKVEEQEFEVHEAYHLDVVMSTGDGKTRELDEKQRSVRPLDCLRNRARRVSYWGGWGGLIDPLELSAECMLVMSAGV